MVDTSLKVLIASLYYRKSESVNQVREQMCDWKY